MKKIITSIIIFFAYTNAQAQFSNKYIDKQNNSYSTYSFDSELKRTGTWEFYENNKLVKSIEYENDMLNGDYRIFKDDILICKATFKNNKVDGEMIRYYPNSDIKYLGFFDQAKEIGEWEYYYKQKKDINEYFKVIAVYSNDDLGSLKMYTPEGKLIEEVTIIESSPRVKGTFKSYKNGKILSEGGFHQLKEKGSLYYTNYFNYNEEGEKTAGEDGVVCSIPYRIISVIKECTSDKIPKLEYNF